METIWAVRFRYSGSMSFQAQVHHVDNLGVRMVLYVEKKRVLGDYLHINLIQIAGPLEMDGRPKAMILKDKLAWLIQNPIAITVPNFTTEVELLACLKEWLVGL